ncbi:MAG: hypothetical protein KF696_15765 [Planctomycetes bacterium]|nr:hypothetical protein [Planctomycetota bacterium]MCW8136235.1 hypothetical protein [Planctomycetota bacterium]
MALRGGDLASHRENIGKDTGLMARALELQQTLDPQAWLVALGAVTREHNLPAAAAAMQRNDEAALAGALGCHEQALRKELLDANHSVHAVRAAGVNYYRRAQPAADAFEGWQPPPLPPGALAYHISALVSVGERDCRLHFGRDRHGMTDLRAAVDLAGKVAPTGGPDATAAMAATGLDTALLPATRYRDLTVRVLMHDATLHLLRLAVDGQGWRLYEHAVTTLAQRLESARDGKLMRIYRTASDLSLRLSRWPAEYELLLGAADWFDPAAPGARNGWAEYEAAPARGFELRQAREPGDIGVIALHQQPQGRRAITRKGDYVWHR